MMALVDRVGVVIIGRNEGTRLERAIASVQDAGLTAVYVDSASTDKSVETAKQTKIAVVELDQSKPLSAARGRNEGVKWLSMHMPKLTYVHFLDGDCELNPDWMLEAVAVLDRKRDVAVVCGRLREKDYQASMFRRLSDISWYIKPGEIMSCGGIATIKVDVFQSVNGFNEGLIAGEEPELYARIRQKGHKILCLENEMGTHDGGISSYLQWWKRSVRTGFAYANAKEWGRWEKARRSLLFWGGLLPALVLVLAFVVPQISLFLLCLYPLQIFRIFVRLDIPYRVGDRLLFATICILDKFPEFLGFLKYHYAKICGRKQMIIEYKNGKETD